MKSIITKFKSLSLRGKILVGVLSLILIVGLTSNSNIESSPTDESMNTSTSEISNKFPKIEGDPDDILEGIIRDFYEDNQNADWWGRIDKVVEGLGTKTAKMVYIKTDYQLNNVDDVEQGTLLCNALISHLPRKGLSIRIDGLIQEGVTLLDGTVESEIVDEPITDFGSSADPDGVPEWCVARTLFYSVVDGLKARGWKMQYGEIEDLTAEEEKKMYEGVFMQEGPIYFKD
jgi:hypothetical protein